MKWVAIVVVLLGLVLGYVLLPENAAAPQRDTGDAAIPGRQVEVYDGISVSTDARTLDISGRELSGSLKAEIRHVRGLEILDASDNTFTGLPAEIGQLVELRVLDLSNNPLTGLPYELGNLQHLETLDLRGTNYAVQDLEVIKKSLPSSTEILTD
jgi:Leucine-rich repeat (LRR) protein